MRTVVQGTPFTTRLDSEVEKDVRFAEFYRGFEWRICREPEEGYPLRGSLDFYLRKFDCPIPGIASVTVLYEYDDAKVHFLELRIVNEPES